MKLLTLSIAALLVLSIAGCTGSDPAVSKSDSRAAMDLVGSYEHAIASGAADEAESMLLDAGSQPVHEWVAKAIAYAQYDTSTVEVDGLTFYWLEDGKLAPDPNGERLYPSELERLDELTRDYPMPGFLTFRSPPSGDLMRFFVVKTADGLKLTR
jgi:hypothetical protein